MYEVKIKLADVKGVVKALYKSELAAIAAAKRATDTGNKAAISKLF